VLINHAIEAPQRSIFHFLDSELAIAEELSLGSIHQQLYCTAHALQAYQDEPCLILLPKSAAFVHAFYGCLAARVIAVPLPAPRKGELTSRHQSVIQQSGVRAVITSKAIYQEVLQKEPSGLLAQLDWLIIEDILANGSKIEQLPELTADTIAILQYTSGSTGDPKGVVVSHLNFMTNAAFIQQVFENNEKSRGVNWLPVFHDMGLVEGIIEPVFANYPVYHIQPVDFVRQPSRWPLAMSKYRATVTGGPNFAFDLAAKKTTPEQIATLDLSNLRVWYNGAERVRPATLDLVCEVFGEVGLHRSKLLPCYGMAETTLAVTLSGIQALPFLHRKTLLGDKERLFVSAGNLGVDTVVKIVDPDTLEEKPLGAIGEIWVKGNTVCQGYWKIDASDTFNLHLHGEGGYFRTGDLGYFHEEQLFIVDRLKDLIIINGVNYYPADMEAHLQQLHPELNDQGIAAFAVDLDDKEQVIIAAEITRKANGDESLQKEINKAIRQAFFRRFSFTPSHVVLLAPRALPRTSSGKISRSNTRKAYLNQTLRQI
jgi:acyl-CoA synthetase (AMP-forming)/AMP-acid ligase II